MLITWQVWHPLRQSLKSHLYAKSENERTSTKDHTLSLPQHTFFFLLPFFCDYGHKQGSSSLSSCFFVGFCLLLCTESQGSWFWCFWRRESFCWYPASRKSIWEFRLLIQWRHLSCFEIGCGGALNTDPQKPNALCFTSTSPLLPTESNRFEIILVQPARRFTFDYSGAGVGETTLIPLDSQGNILNTEFVDHSWRTPLFFILSFHFENKEKISSLLLLKALRDWTTHIFETTVLIERLQFWVSGNPGADCLDTFIAENPCELNCQNGNPNNECTSCVCNSRWGGTLCDTCIENCALDFDAVTEPPFFSNTQPVGDRFDTSGFRFSGTTCRVLDLVTWRDFLLILFLPKIMDLKSSSLNLLGDLPLIMVLWM